MDLTKSSDTSDISARLDRLERSMGKLIDVISQSTLVARADALAGPTPLLGTVGDRLSSALMEISEPEVLSALTRIATLAPQLEAAAHVAAAAPDLLEEALDMARQRMGDDGSQRIQALGEALTQLSKPDVARALAQLGAAAPNLAGPLTAAADAVGQIRAVVGASQVDENLRELTRTVLDPEVTQSLTRIAGLLPQLEYAAFGAAAAPELLEEALEVVRKNVGDDGAQRMQAMGEALTQLSKPEVTRAVGKLGAAIPALTGPLTAAAGAVAEVRAVVGANVVDQQLGELTRTVLDPEVIQSLTRVAGLLPQLEYAAFGAAAVPEVLEEVLQVVRAKTADFHDGVPLEQRLHALAQTGLRLTHPDFVKQLGELLVHAMPLVETLTHIDPKTIEQALKLLELATSQRLQAPLTRLLESLPALSEALLALPTDQGTLAFLKDASDAVADVVKHGAKPVGMFGSFRALSDPQVQKALGFMVAVAHGLGGKLENPTKQLSSGN